MLADAIVAPPLQPVNWHEIMETSHANVNEPIYLDTAPSICV